MDPDECLKELREWAAKADDAQDEWAAATASQHLSEGFQALDSWLRSGGFLPKPWATAVVRKDASFDTLTGSASLKIFSPGEDPDE